MYGQGGGGQAGEGHIRHNQQQPAAVSQQGGPPPPPPSPAGPSFYAQQGSYAQQGGYQQWLPTQFAAQFSLGG